MNNSIFLVYLVAAMMLATALGFYIEANLAQGIDSQSETMYRIASKLLIISGVALLLYGVFYSMK